MSYVRNRRPKKYVCRTTFCVNTESHILQKIREICEKRHISLSHFITQAFLKEIYASEE